MKPSSLRLIITQGPRSGETLDFDSGSRIRIGRVVRGNNVVIKDDGISSKHLLIESESGKWIIQDLDSSNGTAVNSANLVPNTPFYLHDGDTIKLGGYTTILVKIVIDVEDESAPSRKPRLEVKSRVTRSRKNASCVENSALESEVVKKEGKNTRKGRGRKLNLQEMPPEITKVEESSRVGNSSLNNELSADISRLESGIVDNQGKFPRRGRGKKRNLLEVPPESTEVEKYAVPGDLKNEFYAETSGLESRVADNVARFTRKGRKNLEQMRQTITKVEESSETGKANKKNDLFEENSRLECGVTENEGKPKRRGRPARRNLPKMPELGNEVEQKMRSREQCQKNELCVENPGLECEVIENEVNLRQRDSVLQEMLVEDVQVEDLKSGEKEKELKEGSNKVENRFEEKAPDFEKMTLGEWFDYLEVYLPKQIIKETEEMIQGMREKAERFHQYIIEQKKEKSKL